MTSSACATEVGGKRAIEQAVLHEVLAYHQAAWHSRGVTTRKVHKALVRAGRELSTRKLADILLDLKVRGYVLSGTGGWKPTEKAREVL